MRLSDPSHGNSVRPTGPVAEIARDTVQMRPNAPSISAPPAQKCSEMRPGAPECSTLHQPSQTHKTKPPRKLTSRQLAAVRLLVRGVATANIASYLGIDRHTLARWRRLPLFDAEI